MSSRSSTNTLQFIDIKHYKLPEQALKTNISKEEDLLPEINENRPIYFLSLLGTNANDSTGDGIPRNANYWYDVKTEEELKPHGIRFLSAQDLVAYYHDRRQKRSKAIETKNIYSLVEYFIKHNRDGYFFLDEVPLIKGM